MKYKLTSLITGLALSAVLAQPARAEDQPKPTATASLIQISQELTALQRRISSTVASLNQVKESANDPAALQKAVSDYQEQYKALDDQAEKMRKEAVLVRARAKEHYEVWQKDLSEVQSTKIREKAQERFTESKEKFDKIAATVERAKEETVPFMSELKDISIYLEADTSENAVKSLSNTIWKLGNRSHSVISSINDVNEQIDKTIKSLPKK